MERVAVKLAVVAVLCALMIPMKAKAQAMPELSSNTLATLELVQGQLQNTMLNANGLQLYQDASSTNLGSILLLFYGLYEANEAYQNWQAGQGFVVQTVEELDESNTPTGLDVLVQNAEAYKVGLEYFGHRVTMIVNEYGDICQFQDGKQALNVYAKNEMQVAIDHLKVQAPDRKHVPLVHGNQNYTNSSEYPSYNDLREPFVQGNTLTFFLYQGGTMHTVTIENFQNCALCLVSAGDYGFDNGLLSVAQQQDTRNVIVKLDGSVLTPDNNVNSVAYSTPFSGGMGRPAHYKIITGSAPYTNISFKMPLSYRNYSYNSFKNYTDKNFDANIQGMYLGNAIPLGNAQQIFVKVGAVQEIEGYPQTAQQIIDTPISADSLDQIQDAISIIQPVTDPGTGIEILPIPQEFPLPESVPLEVEAPDPGYPIYPDFEGFPESDPSQVPAQNPATDPATSPTEEALPDSAEDIPIQENLSIVTGLQNRFPFSIPWDIYNALSHLSAERQTPHWEWTMNVSLPFSEETFSYTFVLDLGFMASTAQLFRNLFLLAFILGLAVFSYNKFFGGGA